MSYDYLATGCTILNTTALIHVIATPGSNELYYHDSDMATARLNYYLPFYMIHVARYHIFQFSGWLVHESLSDNIGFLPFPSRLLFESLYNIIS